MKTSSSFSFVRSFSILALSAATTTALYLGVFSVAFH